MEIKSFKDLEVWNKAKDLVLKIYAMTANFPISFDLKFMDVDNANELINEIDQPGVKLNNLVNTTRNRATKQ